jgi:hypothetical protein
MAVIKLQTVVGNLTEVLDVFDKIKVYRSVTGLTGEYLELTAPGTRLALEAGKAIYEYTDSAGSSTYYYKSSYYNSVSGLESSLSDAQQGEGDPALDILSVEELKTNYLFGVDLTKDDGTAYPESLFEWYIKSAVSWLEIKLDIPIRPRSFEERHDFFREDYAKYIWLHLKHCPVIDVEEVKLVLPGEQVVQTFDRSWLYWEAESGQLQIVPGSGNIGTILLGAGGSWLPMIFAAARFIPQAFRVKYTAGFSSGTVPGVVRDVLGKLASYGPLNIAGDLIAGAGIAAQSLSIDGLSQSVSTTSSATNAGYGARLLQYIKENKEVIPTLQRYYRGNRMVIG